MARDLEIVTSDAVQTLAEIHDRNPVILPQEMQ